MSRREERAFGPSRAPYGGSLRDLVSVGGGTVSGAGRHARRRYERLFRWLRHPIRGIESETHHLHEIEQKGDSGETPFIAILGLVLFLLPLALVIMALAFGAAWLFG